MKIEQQLKIKSTTSSLTIQQCDDCGDGGLEGLFVAAKMRHVNPDHLNDI